MRIKYCSTSSRDVVRPCSIAVRISLMDASTTVKGFPPAGADARFV